MPAARRGPPSPAPLAALALLSCAALAYEVLLMRLFSIVQWHHFAYLMISVALLGYGAAGSFTTLLRERLMRRFEAAFVAAAATFGATSVAAFLLAQRVPFNPLELLWDPLQPLRLAAVCALLMVPFFCAASAICLSFVRAAAASHRVYAADVVGAAAGSLGIVAGLAVLDPGQALIAVGATGVAAAALAARAFGRRVAALALATLAGATGLAAALAPPELQLSEYKDLAQALRIPGARVLTQASGPLGQVTAVESPRAPFRIAPGLSLASRAQLPDQLGIFIDGDGPMALARAQDPAGLAYLGEVPSALPYRLLERPRVLVLGAGAGADVLQALALGARSVDAVEMNERLVRMIEGPLGSFSGRPFHTAGVRVHFEDARGFAAGSRGEWDLIQIALLDSAGVAAAGLHALQESYVYTVEAFRDYLARLAPGGYLAITRWVALPPRDMAKLFATAVAALEAEGERQPGRRLAMVRGLRTATLLIKNGGITAAEVARMREFCRDLAFDPAWFPGISADESNLRIVLDRPYDYEAARALLGPERERFIAGYKFNIAPATDDSPHFSRFFRWSSLPELWRLREQGGLPLLDWGYPILVLSLALALAASTVLILLPLGAMRSRDAPSGATGKARTAAYFLCLGLAFMFVEIAFMQKFVLFLSRPLYAAASVLGAFLGFAGLGSWYSRRASYPLGAVLIAICALALAYVALLPTLLHAAIAWPIVLRFALTVALIAPLAFLMGMPFPTGLARLSGDAPGLIPWAWGINGCASVVAAVLATLLAVHLGFAVVVGLAAALYGFAALAIPAPLPCGAER